MEKNEQVRSDRRTARRRHEDRELAVLRHVNALFASLTLEEQARVLAFLDNRYLRPARKAMHAEREAMLARAEARVDKASQRVADALGKLSEGLLAAGITGDCCSNGACEEDRYEPCVPPGPDSAPTRPDLPPVPYFAGPPAQEEGS